MRKKSPSYLLFLLITSVCIGTVSAQPRVHFVHCYGDDGSQHFEDIYATADGDFVMCGDSKIRGGRSNFDEQIYVVKANGAGEELWNLTFGQDSVASYSFTIIELDNGDYVVGGCDNRLVLVARITSDGDIDWMRTYDRGLCNALIELKNDDLALAGKLYGSIGLLMRIESDSGDVVWQYEFDEYSSTIFEALRETDEGLMAGGWCYTGDRQHRLVLGEFAQADGEPMWWQDYEQPRPPENSYDAAFDMTSHPHGFVLAGVHNWTHQGSPSAGNTLMVDPDGEVIWQRIRACVVEEFAMKWYGICRLPNGDLVQTGLAGWGSNHPVMNWITAIGEELWHEVYDVRDLGNFVPERGGFKSVVALDDGSVVACGDILNIDAESSYDGFIMKLEPLIDGPVIYFRSPDDSTLKVLQDDTLRFTVGARDMFDRDLSYLWLRNDIDTLATDSTVLVHFPDLGRDDITCQVFSGELADSVRWRVHVVEFYISGFAPDTLDLIVRRNSSVDFSLEVRTLEDIEVEYFWTLVGRGQRREVGNEDSITVLFDLTGDFRLTGLVWREGAADDVEWSVHVRSAVWWWLPTELEQSVPVNTLMEFIIFPFNHESDSLSYRWWLNDDPLDVDTTADLVEVEFSELGHQTLVSIVHDGCEADTVTWEIHVFDPRSVGDDQADHLPNQVSLSTPSPNPFNMRARIDYALPVAFHVRLAVYTIDGRMVGRLVDDNVSAGYHSFVFDADGLSAGLYLVRLEAGGSVLVQKAVVVK